MSSYTTVSYQDCHLACAKDSVLLYRQDALSRDKTLISEDIFKDVSKGQKIDNQKLYQIFGDWTKEQIVDYILMNGNFSLSQRERAKIKEQLFQRLINYIIYHFTDSNGKKYSQEHVEPILSKLKIDVGQNLEMDGQQLFEKNRKKIENKLTLKPAESDYLEFQKKVSFSEMGKAKSKLKKYIIKEDFEDDGVLLTLSMSSENAKKIFG